MTYSVGTSGEELPAEVRSPQYWSPWLLLILVIWFVGLFTIAEDPVHLFARNWVYIPIGFLGAFLGNISAVGGGIVFIPAVMFIFHLPPVTALKVSIATQSWGMTSGAIGWLQNRVIPMTALKIAVPGLLLGSIFSSLIVHPNALLVKLLFGPVSITLGVLSIFLINHPSVAQRKTMIPPDATWPLFVASVVGGVITGWVAVGEGEIVTALLMLAYGVEATTCIALGVVLLSINSIFLTFIHTCFLGGIPWQIAGFTGLGSIFGARLAPWVGKAVDPRVLKAVFGVIAISDGTLFIVQYFILHK